MSGIKKRLVAVILACAITTVSVVNASAINSAGLEVETPIIMYGDGVVVENYALSVGGKNIAVNRTSYENNTSVWAVTEDGNTTTWTVASDYLKILESLRRGNGVSPISESGYTYRYVTTKSDTDHLTPENGTYSAILGVVSAAVGVASLPASVAIDIASILYELGSSSIECWITSTRKFYEVYDAGGNFVGYYRMDYTVVTEAKVNGKRQQVDKQTGSSDSFYIF